MYLYSSANYVQFRLKMIEVSAKTCLSNHREPTQSVCVADSYFIVNVLELPFASPIAIHC